MASRESRAELEVYRPVKSIDAAFLNKVRAIAFAVFGEKGFDRATLRPPLVKEEVAIPAGEPVAKVYDASNLKQSLMWRVSTGDDKAGSKFFKARQALENGIKEKNPHSKLEPYIYRIDPLRKRLVDASQASEVGPNASLRLACSGITMYRHRLVHPGTDIYCLTPDIKSTAYTGLLVEQEVTEQALADVSGYVYNKQNPQTQLLIPFMRVDSVHDEEQRNDFIDLITVPNIIPTTITLDAVEMTIRTS